MLKAIKKREPTESQRSPSYRTLSQVARSLGVHSSTVCRWVLRGAKLRDGTVLRLAAKRSPGRWLVSDEAIDQFIDILTRDRGGETAAVEAAPRSPAARRKAVAEADRALKAAGL
jgi:hypothetical protein